MNELLSTMSTDMGIDRYSEETEEFFVYRVLYSALGLWCLRTAQNRSVDSYGTTKHNQTIVLNNLLDQFVTMFPSVADYFRDTSNPQMSFSVFIRRVYEETGYLITNENNRNEVANYGRSVKLGEKALFFGFPMSAYTVNGLGIYTAPTRYIVPVKEFLIRDNLTFEEYFKANFDFIDFYDRNINANDLEFFNPLSNNVPSRSWENRLNTDCTMARKINYSSYHRVMKISDTLYFADEPIESQDDSFTSYEYRRLYFAMKAHYGTPLKATITKLDNTYSSIRLGGHLPNREYYFLLLMSWPINGVFDKVNFLTHNNLLVEIIDILTNLGIVIEGGNENNE